MLCFFFLGLEISVNENELKYIQKNFNVSAAALKIWHHLNENWSSYEMIYIFFNTLYISSDIKSPNILYILNDKIFWNKHTHTNFTYKELFYLFKNWNKCLWIAILTSFDFKVMYI